MIIRHLTLIIFCVFFIGHSALAANCKNVFSELTSSEKKILVSKIRRNGFTESVAQRIVKDRPDLLDDQLADFEFVPNLAKKDPEFKAVTLYRGLKSPFKKFNPARGTWFSRDMETAEHFADSKRPQESIIIKVQFPSYFYLHGNTTKPGTQSWASIERRLFKNVATFITEVGRLEKNSKGEWKRVWYAYEEAIELGFGKDFID